jgi:SulP family sulfate permease
MFGGMPATGAIARTATNIRSGARSPVAGVLHAVFVLCFMLAFAPLTSYIPLASLAAVLVIVAWNMSEFDRFKHLMRAPWGDRIVLLLTFLLTVVVDLTVAIQVGVVLAAILFMHRMSQAVELTTDSGLIEGDIDDRAQPPTSPQDMHANLPPGIEAFQIRGPFFFGVAARLIDILDHIEKMPKVFILRMGMVPLIDSSGETALEEFIARCRKRGTTVILSRVQRQPMEVLDRMGLLEEEGVLQAANFNAALEIAKKIS